MTDHRGVEPRAALLPCPFCGKLPYAAVKDRAAISCVNDECFGPRTTAEYLEDAIVQWNTRAVEPRADAGGALAEDRISFPRWWVETIRDQLFAMKKLPSGPLGDWAFLFREQLTDALSRTPALEVREAIAIEKAEADKYYDYASEFGHQLQKLRDVVKDAIDILTERKRGNDARSPGHNARIILETALKAKPPALPQSKEAGETAVTEFENELGNIIRITIEGPTSKSTNDLTPIEATKLHEALTRHSGAGAEPSTRQADHGRAAVGRTGSSILPTGASQGEDATLMLELRDAFNGTDIPSKNIALRKAYDAIKGTSK